ncbi:hypothetical protein CPS_0843 [Colwellia psychrerythraea 34H]|uniref:Uncharacterized protein n=1 Tax=Colwellia psychrerythraea (strain 34H / ATCC BAA-681) TaxID=167879 RepID=Q488C3_COLP3|nr:hypothetical protein CPS_0843 [Colwellia psychrerythraea 34H]
MLMVPQPANTDTMVSDNNVFLILNSFLKLNYIRSIHRYYLSFFANDNDINDLILYNKKP